MFSSVCVTPPTSLPRSLPLLASVFYCNYRVAALCGPKVFGNRSIAHCSSLHPAALLAEINGHTLISEASSGRHHSTCNASPTSLSLFPLSLTRCHVGPCLWIVLCLGHCHLTLLCPGANQHQWQMRRQWHRRHRITSTRHSSAYENNNCGNRICCLRAHPSPLPFSPLYLCPHSLALSSSLWLVGFIAVLLVENKLITWTSSSDEPHP